MTDAFLTAARAALNAGHLAIARSLLELHDAHLEQVLRAASEK